VYEQFPAQAQGVAVQHAVSAVGYAMTNYYHWTTQCMGRLLLLFAGTVGTVPSAEGVGGAGGGAGGGCHSGVEGGAEGGAEGGHGRGSCAAGAGAWSLAAALLLDSESVGGGAARGGGGGGGGNSRGNRSANRDRLFAGQLLPPIDGASAPAAVAAEPERRLALIVPGGSAAVEASLQLLIPALPAWLRERLEVSWCHGPSLVLPPPPYPAPLPPQTVPPLLAI
jgi:hypothetical protein